MRGVYRVLAGLIAIEVVVQAAAIAYAVFGLTKWIDGGGTLDKAAMESEETSFDGIVGFMVHGINGMMLMPLLALMLLIVAFFAKVSGGIKWAGLILLAIVAQVLLGVFAHDMPGLGAIHGLNALIIFGLAVMAFMRSKTPVTTTDDPERAEHRTAV